MSLLERLLHHNRPKETSSTSAQELNHPSLLYSLRYAPGQNGFRFRMEAPKKNLIDDLNAGHVTIAGVSTQDLTQAYNKGWLPDISAVDDFIKDANLLREDPMGSSGAVVPVEPTIIIRRKNGDPQLSHDVAPRVIIEDGQPRVVDIEQLRELRLGESVAIRYDVRSFVVGKEQAIPRVGANVFVADGLKLPEGLGYHMSVQFIGDPDDKDKWHFAVQVAKLDDPWTRLYRPTRIVINGTNADLLNHYGKDGLNYPVDLSSHGNYVINIISGDDVYARSLIKLSFDDGALSLRGTTDQPILITTKLGQQYAQFAEGQRAREEQLSQINRMDEHTVPPSILDGRYSPVKDRPTVPRSEFT